MDTRGFRLKARPHPGGFIRSEIIEPAELSVKDAADVLGVTRPTLSALLNKRASLSPEMALRIEKAFGVSMDTLRIRLCACRTAMTSLRPAREKGRSQLHDISPSQKPSHSRVCSDSA